MERVEGLLQSLKLSDKEKKGIKIGWAGSANAGVVESQAPAKLLSEKPMFVDAMAETLGKIWCPIGGWIARRSKRMYFCSCLGRNRVKGWLWMAALGSLGMPFLFLKILMLVNALRTIRSRPSQFGYE